MATQQIEIRAVDKTQAALRNVNRNLNQVQSSLLSVNKIAAIAVTALGAIGGANNERICCKCADRTTCGYRSEKRWIDKFDGGPRN